MRQLPHPCLRVEKADDVAFVRFTAAALRDETVRGIRRQLVGLVSESGKRELHLDLGEVGRVTAGGLGTLVALHKELQAAGAHLVLVNVGGTAHEVFAVTGLTELLDVRPK